MINQILIKKYIDDQKLNWAPTTLCSELARLNALIPHLDGNPITLWNHVNAAMKPYTRVTTWTRVVKLQEWLLLNGLVSGDNTYEAFRQKNQRLFKNAYIPKFPEISFQEAKRRIETLGDGDVRQFCQFLLCHGARASEYATYKEGSVT